MTNVLIYTSHWENQHTSHQDRLSWWLVCINTPVIKLVAVNDRCVSTHMFCWAATLQLMQIGHQESFLLWWSDLGPEDMMQGRMSIIALSIIDRQQKTEENKREMRNCIPGARENGARKDEERHPSMSVVPGMVHYLWQMNEMKVRGLKKTKRKKEQRRQKLHADSSNTPLDADLEERKK